ncbi:hypothetical protein Mspyr1_11960 [Mycolicibacterium gilvum Spyr1]|uniref:Uncharacterized protein n=1 Tax=Mycolicibacterium gilvum (strain DSM 45189 / LMG 24558 / Spyr1) TaxID=278137 RepID=E6TGZ8_MYCSR|nr:hypothetical protein Mspyr1_11960 [Mycolicibacterium gilvum Spyr1]
MRAALVGLVMVAAAGLSGCGAPQDDDLASPADNAPPYRLEIGEKDSTLRVFVDQLYSPPELESIVVELQKQYRDQPDGYFVQINCAEGGSERADNRLANARFAVGAIGAARTGLDDGERKFEPRTGVKCPPDPLPEATPGAVTARKVVDAFIASGLPATDPRDNTNNICDSVKCVQLITTDDVSVYQFADEQPASRWAAGLSGTGVADDMYKRGLIVLRYNLGGSNPTDAAAIPQYQAVLDGLVG